MGQSRRVYLGVCMVLPPSSPPFGGIEGSRPLLTRCFAVGQVRETSRKPDEMYSLLERLSPGTRKLVRGTLHQSHQQLSPGQMPKAISV